MIKKVLFLLLTTASLLSYATTRPATQNEIEVIRDGLQTTLKDAESAKFRNVKFGSGANKDTVCGEVNSKNSYGAYVGFRYFIGTSDLLYAEKPPIFVLVILDDIDNQKARATCAQLEIL